MSESRRKKKAPSRETQGFLGLKRGLEAGVWWSRGELNPRPSAINEKIYMFSCLI